jgi:hypothetical protein
MTKDRNSFFVDSQYVKNSEDSKIQTDSKSSMQKDIDSLQIHSSISKDDLIITVKQFAKSYKDKGLVRKIFESLPSDMVEQFSRILDFDAEQDFIGQMLRIAGEEMEAKTNSLTPLEPNHFDEFSQKKDKKKNDEVRVPNFLPKESTGWYELKYESHNLPQSPSFAKFSEKEDKNDEVQVPNSSKPAGWRELKYGTNNLLQPSSAERTKPGTSPKSISGSSIGSKKESELEK